MKNFTKAQQAQIDAALDRCAEAAGLLDRAVQAFNESMDEKRHDVMDWLGTYNEKLAELKGLYEALGLDARNYYDERSERWQESDAGSAYSDWAETLENPPDMDEVEIDFPEPLEVEIPDFSDTGWLPPPEPEE